MCVIHYYLSHPLPSLYLISLSNMSSTSIPDQTVQDFKKAMQEVENGIATKQDLAKTLNTIQTGLASYYCSQARLVGTRPISGDQFAELMVDLKTSEKDYKKNAETIFRHTNCNQFLDKNLEYLADYLLTKYANTVIIVDGGAGGPVVVETNEQKLKRARDAHSAATENAIQKQMDYEAKRAEIMQLKAEIAIKETESTAAWSALKDAKAYEDETRTALHEACKRRRT